MSINKSDYIKAINWEQFKNFNGIQSDFIINKFIGILNIEHKESYPAILFPQLFKDILYRKFTNGKKYNKKDDEIYFEELITMTSSDFPLFYRSLPSFKRKFYLYNYKPEPKVPQKEEIPLTYTTRKIKFPKGCLCGLFGWTFPIFYLLKIEQYIPYTLHKIVLGIVCVISFVLLIIFSESDIDFEVEEKEKKYSFFQRIRLRIKRDKLYEKEIEKYHNLLANLPEAISKYEEIRKFQSNEIEAKGNIICQSIIKKALSISTKFIQVNVGAPKGYTEDNLFYRLMKYIPKQIFIDGKVGKYYPDLIVKTSNGVCIDIEIDEPYEYKDKKETHYIGCGDKERDNYFLDNNWFVIRFSEYQIKYYTNRCVRIVLLLKDLIELGDCKYDSLVDLVNKISMPFWTKEEARVMAIENFRENAPRPIDW